MKLVLPINKKVDKLVYILTPKKYYKAVNINLSGDGLHIQVWIILMYV